MPAGESRLRRKSAGTRRAPRFLLSCRQPLRDREGPTISSSAVNITATARALGLRSELRVAVTGRGLGSSLRTRTNLLEPTKADGLSWMPLLIPGVRSNATGC